MVETLTQGQMGTSFVEVPLSGGDEEAAQAQAKIVAAERLGGDDVYLISWTKVSEETCHSVWGRNFPEIVLQAEEKEDAGEEREET